MNTNYTTIEQSNKLVELGLDPGTADMYYYRDLLNNDKTYEIGILKHRYNADTYSHKEGLTIPCWSAGQLMELMPVIETETEPLSSAKLYKGSSCHSCYWAEYPGLYIDDIDVSETPVDACFIMVCWLLENGYKLNTK